LSIGIHIATNDSLLSEYSQLRSMHDLNNTIGSTSKVIGDDLYDAHINVLNNEIGHLTSDCKTLNEQINLG